MTGRVAVFHGPGQPLEIVEVAAPPLAAGELLVRVMGCTLCRSDLHSYTGRRTVATPTVLGHEVVGKIEAVGPGAPTSDLSGRSAAIGDRITWSIIAACGECFFCTHDLPQKCTQLRKFGHECMTASGPFTGGLADFVVLRRGAAWLRLRDGLPDSIAALANCAGATAAAVVRYAGQLQGERVVVMGAGVLGAIACAMAATAGARAIIAVDPNHACRGRAARFGAAAALDPTSPEVVTQVMDATEGRGADVVLELAGSAASVQTGLALVRVGGTMVLAGAVAPCGPLAIDPETIVRRMMTLRGVHNYHPRDLAAAVEFLNDNRRRFPFDELVSNSYPLARADEAFQSAQATLGERVMVVPG
jgi:alcohol dehydrogenase